MILVLFKDIYSAQYRVLDHKVFINGEIEAFLKNFEEQRNDSEVESLFKVTETVGALKYDLSDKCINLGSLHLNEISTELKDILGKVEDLLEAVQTPKEVSSYAKGEQQHLTTTADETSSPSAHNYKNKQRRPFVTFCFV